MYFFETPSYLISKKKGHHIAVLTGISLITGKVKHFFKFNWIMKFLMPIVHISIKAFVLHKDWKHFPGTIVILQSLGHKPFLDQREVYKIYRILGIL